MSECEVLESCPFFKEKMEDMPEHVELFKTLYCRGNNQVCARYMVLKEIGREQVPSDLFPNHVEEANNILFEAKIGNSAS